MIYASVEELETIPDWIKNQYQHYVDLGACFISIASPIPGLNKDVDPTKAQKAGIAQQKGYFIFLESF